MLALQDQLVRLKAEALNRFTEGDLECKELLGAFVTRVQGVYDHLPRLITAHRGRPEHPGKGPGQWSSPDGAEIVRRP